MKKRWVFVSALALTLVLAACGSSESSDVEGMEDANETAAVEQESEATGLHEFEYMNQDNEVVTNEDLKGKYSLVNMVFTRCPTVCNLMTPNMTNLQNELDEKGLDVNLVSFTVDPEHDTPEKLKAYGEQYDADFSNWDFLTGYDREEVESFAASSFNSVVQSHPENDDIIHSTQTYLLDINGQVVEQFDGLEVDKEPIIDAIETLVEMEK
ncbi:SCO family protein [Geomicrobium sediminis]|uniref:Protein SCO1/2 n=1 Tax=Geomicrobium sediminis TaxID=1347788 RepID=A0ABS2P7W1_9BACL|nr:SCO family protein [Geomicrobium sediminis]MBM7631494.1 protein SCO1/2 [Geomicrobium sediminis]